MRTDKELPRIERRVLLRLLQLIEVCVGGVELVLKQIGQRNNPSAACVHQVRRVFRTTSTTAEHANADGGVRLCATDQLGLDEHRRGGGSRDTQEGTAVDV